MDTLSLEICVLHHTIDKEVEPLSSKDLKAKEERILKLYINAYITETQFYEMLKRVRESK